MTLAVARFCRVVAITAFVFGMAAALRAPSLLAQSNATIQTTVTVLPAQTAVQTHEAALAAGMLAARTAAAAQPAAPVVVVDSSGLVAITTQPQVDASAAAAERRQRSVRLRVEYTAN